MSQNMGGQSENFDKLFSDLIAETQRAVDGLVPTADQLGQTEEVVGHAHDDRISVYMKAGKVTRVELQPPVRKLDLPELGEHLVTAINAALEANIAALTAQQGDQPDFAQLSQRLQSIQAESVRQLNKYTEGMHEMLRSARDLGSTGSGVNGGGGNG
ncbi:hypothetical protein ACQB6R_13635 [Propionibacteriaceae bacterium G1746]|uniref:hypothetical protein n=1 Tax=Aestuariimicrobium sp. G57 TaxID=3418485 RepID=UPI003C22DC16